MTSSKMKCACDSEAVICRAKAQAQRGIERLVDMM